MGPHLKWAGYGGLHEAISNYSDGFYVDYTMAILPTKMGLMWTARRPYYLLWLYVDYTIGMLPKDGFHVYYMYTMAILPIKVALMWVTRWPDYLLRWLLCGLRDIHHYVLSWVFMWIARLPLLPVGLALRGLHDGFRHDHHNLLDWQLVVMRITRWPYGHLGWLLCGLHDNYRYLADWLLCWFFRGL